MSNFISTGKAVQRLGLCARTLRKLAEDGKIKHMLTDGGRYRFDVEDYLSRRVKEEGAISGEKNLEKV